MNQSQNAAIEVLKALYILPLIPTSLWVWVAPAFVLFINGQLGEAVFWFLFMGPLFGTLAGTFWPIYWYIILSNVL